MAIKKYGCLAMVRLAFLVVGVAGSTACGQQGSSGDIFADWLVLLENKVNLGEIVAATDVEETEKSGALHGIARLEYAPFTKDDADLSSILVYTYREKGETLFALNPVSLESAGFWNRRDWNVPPNEMLPLIKETPAGFLAGGWLIDPADLSADPSPVLAGTPYGEVLVFSGGTPARNYLVRMSYDDVARTASVQTSAYDADFNMVSLPVSRPLGMECQYSRLLDAEYAGGMYRLLLLLQVADEGWRRAYVFSFGDEAGFMSTAAFFAADGTPLAGPEVSGPITMYDENSWLTSDGMVTLERSYAFRLIRYEYGSIAAIIDEFSFSGDTEGLDVLNFDSGGTWWFMFDTWTGMLYKLRTWW